ncbi:hypothetical protein [Mesorhizobium sp. M2D.F.Ca.ET.223.01.1.1]|nr:hypothetical protein [Mesorhizobium sp. M2D.F.Ca.ET.223.01.1.1]
MGDWDTSRLTGGFSPSAPNPYLCQKSRIAMKLRGDGGTIFRTIPDEVGI